MQLLRPGSADPIAPEAIFKSHVPAFSGGISRLDGGALPGGLTRVGLQQGIGLGGVLRARYVDARATTSSSVQRSRYLLPGGWERGGRLVHARSTCVERTVYTCSGVLAGLYPELAARATDDAPAPTAGGGGGGGVVPGIAKAVPVVDIHLSASRDVDEFLVSASPRSSPSLPSPHLRSPHLTRRCIMPSGARGCARSLRRGSA